MSFEQLRRPICLVAHRRSPWVRPAPRRSRRALVRGEKHKALQLPVSAVSPRPGGQSGELSALFLDGKQVKQLPLLPLPLPLTLPLPPPLSLLPRNAKRETRARPK